MNLYMPVIRHPINESQDMFTGLRIEAVCKHGIRRAIIANKFKFRVIDNNVAVTLDSKLGTYLQSDLRFIGIRRQIDLLAVNSVLAV